MIRKHFLMEDIRIYQDQTFSSHSTPAIVPQSQYADTSAVKLRNKSKLLYRKASDYRHSWSEYIIDDNSNNIVHQTFVSSNFSEKRSSAAIRKLSFTGGLTKRTWTGSDTKLSDIKESEHLNETADRLYDRRNAISIIHLNVSPEKKSAEKRWMGIRRKISVTVCP